MVEQTYVVLSDGRYFVVDGSVSDVAARLNTGPTLTQLVCSDTEIWINAAHVLHVRPESLVEPRADQARKSLSVG